MNLIDLLPTKKVTAFLLGAAVAVVAMWLLVDVFGVLDEWPDTWILMAWTIIVGFVLAWVVPEGAWARAGQQGGVDAEA